MTERRLEHIVALLVYSVLAVVTLRNLGIVGVIEYRDLEWPYYLDAFYPNLFYAFDLDSTKRSPYFGSLVALCLYLGVPSGVLERSLFFALRVAIPFSAYLVMGRLLRDTTNRVPGHAAPLLCGFLYAYNPFAASYISTTMFTAFAYSLLPLTTYFYYRMLKEGKRSDTILAAFLSMLTVSASIHFLVVLPLIFLSFFVCELLFALARKNVKFCFLVVTRSAILCALFLAFSLYWVLPSFVVVARTGALQPSYVLTLEMLHAFSWPGFADVIRLAGDWLPRVKLSIPELVPQWLWALLTYTGPILAFASLLTLGDMRRSRAKLVLSFSSLAIAAAFLNKGSQPPMAEFYSTLYDLPIVAWMFRVPSKFGTLLALTYTFLTGFLFDNVGVFLKHRETVGMNLKPCARVAPCLLMVWLIASTSVVVWPMFTGDFGGAFQTSTLRPGYAELHSWLYSQDGKAIVPPLVTPQLTDLYLLTYQSSIPDSYYWKWYSRTLINNSSHAGRLVSPLNVEYFVVSSVPPYDKISSYLTRQEEFHLEKVFGSIYVFSNNANIHRDFFVTSKVISDYGGLRDLNALNFIDQFTPLKSSLTFATESRIRHDFPGADITLLNARESDVALSYVLDRYSVTLFDKTFHHNPARVWSRASATDPLHGPFHSYLEERRIDNWDFDYGTGLVLTWGKDTLEVPLRIEQDDQYEVFIRYFRNAEGGIMSLRLDGRLLRDVNTIGDKNGFVWEKILTLPLTGGEHLLTLENVEGFNAVNLLAIVPTDEYTEAVTLAEGLAESADAAYSLESEYDFSHEGAEVVELDQASSGRALVMKPDSRAWAELETLRPGTHSLAIRSLGHLKLRIDGSELEIDSATLKWNYLPSVHLEKGVHHMEIYPEGSQAVLDVVWLYCGSHGQTLEEVLADQEGAARVMNYVKMDPTKWRVVVNASRPYMLCFAESYSPLWEAQADGYSAGSISLYSLINGFWIGKTGLYTVTVEYEPQKWFLAGAVASIVVMLLCLVYAFDLLNHARADTRIAKRRS